MLRPATPLSVVLLVAFVMLLFTAISVPVTKIVPLGEFNNVKYGAFGYCDGDKCSSIGLGYPASIFSDDTQKFDLPNSIRRTLSMVLVLHPVAAFLTLIMFCLAAAAHMHSPAHSGRYLLLLFLLALLTFLISLGAFIVDVLLFIPHPAWGTYITLAATIILAISTVVSCAMRRSIMGRKARRKRIAENAEMSGENYYNREGQVKTIPLVESHATIPAVGGGHPGAGDALPAFATFESPQKDDQVSDERIPLTQRSPVEKPIEVMAINDGQGMGVAAAARSPSRDRYGNPTNAPPPSYGPPIYARGRGGGPRGGQGGANGRGGFDAYGMAGRGRGMGRQGYGPPPGRGGARGRGGYGPPPRGAYGPGGMRGGRGPPPVAGYGNMPPAQYDQRPPIEEYGPYTTSQAPPMDRGWNGSQSGNSDLPRAESPPPLPGQALTRPPPVGMGAIPPNPPHGFGNQINNQLRDSDLDVAGMVGLQQGRAIGVGGGRDTIMSEGSRYSTDEQYVPPRAAWNQGTGRNSPRTASPARSFRPAPPELPGQAISTSRRGSLKSDYYEDVDPRFDDMSPAPLHFAQGRGQPISANDNDYEDVHAIIDGARSPVESERSNFTSISQRGVNPQWDQVPPMPNQIPPLRRPVQAKQQTQDLLLNNPDFQLPGSRAQGPNRVGPGMIPGSAYPAGAI